MVSNENVMKVGLLLLVICCISQENNGYRYEAKNLKDTTQNGVLYSTQKYKVGDTLDL